MADYTQIKVREGENGDLVSYRTEVLNQGTPNEELLPVAGTIEIAGAHETLVIELPNSQYGIALDGLREIHISSRDPESTIKWRASLTAGQVASPTATSAIEPDFYGKTKIYQKTASGNNAMTGNLYVAATNVSLQAPLILIIEKWWRV